LGSSRPAGRIPFGRLAAGGKRSPGKVIPALSQGIAPLSAFRSRARRP
jgi:hypothetical protein